MSTPTPAAASKASKAAFAVALLLLVFGAAPSARAEDPVEWKVAQHLEGLGRFWHAAEVLRAVPAEHLDPRLSATREAWLERLQAKHAKKLDADLAVIERLARSGSLANALALVLRIAEYGSPADIQRACAALAGPMDAEAEERPARAGPEPTSTTGVIRCLVRFEGTAPEVKRIVISGVEGCDCDEAVSEEVVVNANGTLRHCIVWLDSSQFAGQTFTPPAEPVEVDQRFCVFVPHVATVQTGQPLVYRNSDRALHNVHTYSRANNATNTASTPGTTTKGLKLRREEIFAVKCDVHPWMSSFVGVFPHPYHAVTADDGAAFLGAVPPGEYTLRVWHEKHGQHEAKVRVEAKERALVEVVIKGGG